MQEKNKLKWCCCLKDGIKIIEPDSELAKTYLAEAKSSLKRAEKDLADKDLLWATVVMYYAEYYALYSFLQRIGIKCENHFCSILAAEKLLGADKTITINEQKDKRIDAQYYMRIGKEEEAKQMFIKAKIFVAQFDNLTSNLTNNEVDEYRTRFKNLIK